MPVRALLHPQHATSSRRLTPSLSIIERRWFFAVCSEMRGTSAAATSRFDLPGSSEITSHSRGVLERQIRARFGLGFSRSSFMV